MSKIRKLGMVGMVLVAVLPMLFLVGYAKTVDTITINHHISDALGYDYHKTTSVIFGDGPVMTESEQAEAAELILLGTVQTRVVIEDYPKNPDRYAMVERYFEIKPTRILKGDPILNDNGNILLRVPGGETEKYKTISKYLPLAASDEVFMYLGVNEGETTYIPFGVDSTYVINHGIAVNYNADMINSEALVKKHQRIIKELDEPQSVKPNAVYPVLAWTPTDTKYFGQEDYLTGILQMIGTVEPNSLREESDVIIAGQITNKTYTFDYTGQSTPDEPAIRIIQYEVNISDVLKGTYTNDTIQVINHIRSNLDFDIGENILVMAISGGTTDTIEPIAGPHGMFKIIDDKLIGHIKTLEMHDMFPGQTIDVITPTHTTKPADSIEFGVLKITSAQEPIIRHSDQKYLVEQKQIIEASGIPYFGLGIGHPTGGLTIGFKSQQAAETYIPMVERLISVPYHIEINDTPAEFPAILIPIVDPNGLPTQMVFGYPPSLNMSEYLGDRISQNETVYGLSSDNQEWSKYKDMLIFDYHKSLTLFYDDMTNKTDIILSVSSMPSWFSVPDLYSHEIIWVMIKPKHLQHDFDSYPLLDLSHVEKNIPINDKHNGTVREMIHLVGSDGDVTVPLDMRFSSDQNNYLITGYITEEQAAKLANILLSIENTEQTVDRR